MPEPSQLTGSATRPVFLSAEWRKFDPGQLRGGSVILHDHLPHGTELDFFHGTCYVSLVGFHFANVRLKGIPIPFHTDFEEVNLRFYVRYRTGSGWQRGVVFIREFVRKPALTFVAHTLYGEHYKTVPMDHHWQVAGDPLLVRYRWKKQRWHSLEVTASAIPQDIITGSEEEFITEHNRGYTRLSATSTAEYAVEHPTWQVYPIRKTAIDVDFGASYGEQFQFLTALDPRSVFLAEGSPIVVRQGVRLNG